MPSHDHRPVPAGRRPSGHRPRAARSGRSADDVKLTGIVICSIAGDTATARREAAAQIAFYVAPNAYGPVMEASGFGAEAAAIRAAFLAGDHGAMTEAVSPSMLDQMAVAGTADEVRDALAAVEKAVPPLGALLA